MSFSTPPLSDIERALVDATERYDGLFQEGQATVARDASRNAAVLLVELLGRSFEDVTVHAGTPSGKGPPSWPADGGSEMYWLDVSTGGGESTFLLESHSSDIDGDPASRWVVSDEPPASVTDERRWPATSVLSGRCDDDRLVLWTAILWTRQWGERLFLDDRSGSLVNNCFDLAGKLLDHLGPIWGGPKTSVPGRSTCYVMRGGLRTESFDPERPTTIREAERSGQIHFWVEAVNDDADVTYICDPWGRGPTAFGEPFVLTEYPDNYVPTADGAITFAEMDGDRHWADPLE